MSEDKPERVSNAGVGCRIPAFIVIIPLVALIFTMGGLWPRRNGRVDKCVRNTHIYWFGTCSSLGRGTFN